MFRLTASESVIYTVGGVPKLIPVSVSTVPPVVFDDHPVSVPN